MRKKGKKRKNKTADIEAYRHNYYIEHRPQQRAYYRKNRDRLRATLVERSKIDPAKALREAITTRKKTVTIPTWLARKVLKLIEHIDERRRAYIARQKSDLTRPFKI